LAFSEYLVYTFSDFTLIVNGDFMGYNIGKIYTLFLKKTYHFEVIDSEASSSRIFINTLHLHPSQPIIQDEPILGHSRSICSQKTA